MELFRHIDNGQTDRQTNGLTELFLKSLSRLKMRKCVYLLHKTKLEKVVEVRPPIFFNFRGLYFFNFFKFLLISEIWVFGAKNYLPK